MFSTALKFDFAPDRDSDWRQTGIIDLTLNTDFMGIVKDRKRVHRICVSNDLSVVRYVDTVEYSHENF